MKKCPHCHQTKPLSEFHINHARKNSYQSWCKPCKNTLMRDTRLLRPTPSEGIRVMPQWGEKRYNAKLTAQDVRMIRVLINDGLSCVSIADKFEVSRQCISDIKSGKNWYRLL